MRRGWLIGCVALLLSGCGALYEWRDEPYVRPVYEAGEAAAREKMQSRLARERDIGCRAISIIAREAAARGETKTARRIAAELMAHFKTEPSAEVRAAILAVDLRNAGRDNPAVNHFLLERLAAGESPVSAAYTLASFRATGAFSAIHNAYRKTNDYAVRYELLGALWLLGDARGVLVYNAALAELRAKWPSRIHHMPKAQYAKNLRARRDSLRQATSPK